MHVLPTDKDSGFAVVLHEHLVAATDAILAKDCYTKIPFFDSSTCIDLFEPYVLAVNSVAADMKDLKLKSALMGDVRHVGPDSLAGMVANLQFTVKTHKPAGEVVPRALHAYNLCPMNRGMRLMSKWLREGLCRYPHILKDSGDLLSKVSRMVFPKSCRFLKFDIADFYMTGSHDMLVRTSSLVCDSSVRSLYCTLGSAILSSQYIQSAISPGVYRVKCGAGMGMSASGDVADASFYTLAEKPFILQPSTRRRYRILFYARFKDDGFMIVDPDDGVCALRDMLEDFKTHAAPFRIKLESISKTSCQMLDLSFTKGDGGRLDYSLYKKQTSIWQPLSSESMHSYSIHKHWPLAQCKRIRGRFSRKADGESAVQSFKREMFSVCGKNIEEIVCPNRLKQTASWMVLPYCFELGSLQIQRFLSSVKVPKELTDLFGSVKVSWRLGSKHLIHLLRRSKHAHHNMDA